MPNSDKIPLKSFLKNIEERIASLTSEQLRSIIMKMAMEVLPSGRHQFLDKLIIAEAEKIEEKSPVYQEDLLNDIRDFIEELESEMEENHEPDDGYGYYDDEDDLGPYEDYLGEFEELFSKTNSVFEEGNLELAKNAYQKLFHIFEIDDDYGRGIDSHHLNEMDMKAISARYLRSVYEITPLPKRPQLLFNEMLHVLSMVRDRKITLQNLIEASTKPLPDKEQFLNDWISFLRSQDSKEADYWLREAISLTKGVEGLKELALSDGRKHPRAYLDWASALMDEGKHHDVIEAVENARQALPADMPIRATISDFLWQAAEHVGDKELSSTARWESFYAKPELSRLLDLWESTSDESQRMELMQQASERIKEYLAKNLTFSFSFPGTPLDNDDSEKYVHLTKSNLAHAYLLGKNWESAHEMSIKGNEVGWSNSDNPQGLVVICFLGLTVRNMSTDFPPNLVLLWDEALTNSLSFYDNSETTLSRLKEAYEEVFSNASLDEKEESFLSWCLNISEKRATSIVQNQYRKSYWKAASLITACAEVLKIRGEEQKGRSMTDEIRNKFPRHRAFQTELEGAIARR